MENNFSQKNKILVFSKFTGYGVGGAQLSFLNLLKNLNADFDFVGCRVKKSFLAERFKINGISVKQIPIIEIPKFPYLEYFLNRNKVAHFFRKEKSNYLFTQGIWGAMAINNFEGKTVFFIRDEYNLGRVPNYFSGLKWLFKEIYLFFQKPILNLIFFDVKKAVEKSDLVVANSKFMAKRIKEIFGKEAEIIYPIIEVEKLEKIKMPPFSERKYITLIGAEFIKGREIVEKIAKKMRNHNFLIVGRGFEKPFQKENILYFPWQKDVLEIYKKTKLVLIPSVWEEAFCRVGVEAMALGILVLGSNKGGIPEVLDEEFIVKDLWNIDKWCQKIEFLLKHYQKIAPLLKEKAKKFEAKIQIEKFRKIVKEKLGLDL